MDLTSSLQLQLKGLSPTSFTFSLEGGFTLHEGTWTLARKEGNLWTPGNWAEVDSGNLPFPAPGESKPVMTISGLNPETYYSFRLTTENAAGPGSFYYTNIRTPAGKFFGSAFVLNYYSFLSNCATFCV